MSINPVACYAVHSNLKPLMHPPILQFCSIIPQLSVHSLEFQSPDIYTYLAQRTGQSYGPCHRLDGATANDLHTMRPTTVNRQLDVACIQHRPYGNHAVSQSVPPLPAHDQLHWNQFNGSKTRCIFPLGTLRWLRLTPQSLSLCTHFCKQVSTNNLMKSPDLVKRDRNVK